MVCSTAWPLRIASRRVLQATDLRSRARNDQKRGAAKQGYPPRNTRSDSDYSYFDSALGIDSGTITLNANDTKAKSNIKRFDTFCIILENPPCVYLVFPLEVMRKQDFQNKNAGRKIFGSGGN